MTKTKIYSRLYDEMKHGWKVNIGLDIAEKARDYVFKYGWDSINAEVHEYIKGEVMHTNYFIDLILREATETEAEAFDKLIKEKVSLFFTKFANQKASPKQIFYYQSLCDQLEIEPKQIHKNIEISKEIDKLSKLKEEQRTQIDESIEEVKQALAELKAAQYDPLHQLLDEFGNEVHWDLDDTADLE